jgi:hypothetical protein
VSINRKSLESDRVSATLHKWTDLIWGEWQRGDRAEFGNKVFMPEMYDSGWTSAAQCSPDRRAAIEEITSLFGQTHRPCSPHPARPSGSCLTPLVLTPLLISRRLRGLFHTSVRSAAVDFTGNLISLALDTGRASVRS